MASGHSLSGSSRLSVEGDLPVGSTLSVLGTLTDAFASCYTLGVTSVGVAYLSLNIFILAPTSLGSLSVGNGGLRMPLG